MHAGKVSEDALDSIPVCHPGVGREPSVMFVECWPDLGDEGGHM